MAVTALPTPLLAACFEDTPVVKLYSCASQALLHTLAGHTGPVKCIAFSEASTQVRACVVAPRLEVCSPLVSLTTGFSPCFSPVSLLAEINSRLASVRISLLYLDSFCVKLF